MKTKAEKLKPQLQRKMDQGRGTHMIEASGLASIL